jgi:hypothetical protein
MGRKRQDRDLSPHLSPICQRMDWLLRHIWANNMTQLARDLGVSQTAVARVLAGQVPSGRMMEALATRHAVNLRWLLTGQGQETLGQVGAAGGAFWPVVTRLLPGRPVDNPELLGPLTLPAASAFLLECPYWVQVTSAMPVVSSATWGIGAGDWLLVETAERWTRRPEAYLGRLIAVRLPGERGVILASGDRDSIEVEETPQHALNTFGVCKEARLFPMLTREVAQREPPESLSGGPDVAHVFADDVVGVVLQRVTFLDR